MSIESIEYNGPVVLTCDTCKDTALDFKSFQKALDFKKKQKTINGGWRSYKQGDVWMDACPTCVANFKVGANYG